MVEQVYKVDTRSGATAYGRFHVLFSLPFVSVGAYFSLAGFGFIPLPGKANAPLWVIGFVGLAFLLAGLMLGGYGVRGILNKHRIRRIQTRHPNEPWFLDYPWDQRGIRDKAASRVLSTLTFVLFLAIFLAPFNWWAWLSPDGVLGVKIIVSLFDLALLLVTGGFVYRLLQFFRYGYSRLRFHQFPYYPGERLQVGFAGTPLDRIKATLRFIEERFETRGSGKNRSTQLVSYAHYSDEKVFPGAGRRGETVLQFELPENTDWVTALSGQPVRYWELLIESEQPGVDFRTTFPLPVYARP